MPISSSKIISYINNLSSPFTANHLVSELIPTRSKKKRKKKNTKSSDVDKINHVLRALVSISYLEKHRKSYVISPHFTLTGAIRINSSGNGILKTEYDEEIIIKRDSANNAHNNDIVEAEIIDFKRGYYYARVKKILNRKRKRHFAKAERKTKKHIYYQLLDSPGKIEVCHGRHAEEPEIGNFAIVKLKAGSINGIQECVVEKSFTPDERYDVQRISIKHSLPEPHKDYKELNYIVENIHNNNLQNRKNYTNLFTITIDGEDAKDFDDAISLETSPGKYKLYVHIADVSSYIKKNSELDREASKRGTSFYLGNHVIPMLPEILSNNICSLKEGEKRLTLSVEITFDKKGNKKNVTFHRGVIKVDKRLTYEEAELLINQNKKISGLLKEMDILTTILKQNRMSEGRIDLTLEDSKIIYNQDVVTDIDFYKRLKSHIIIEEFMLSANEVVSKALRENNIPSLYRAHESISNEKMLYLKKFLSSLNLNLKKSANIGAGIQSVINEVTGKEYEQVVNFIILKSFMQAYYGVKPLGHFGLGFKDYTHFTSPIRRYPDLVVHRCLESLIDNSERPYTIEELMIIGEKSSEMERVAQNAERDLVKMTSCRLMKDRLGETFDAIISGISKFGFFVALKDKPVEGMVPLRFLTDDFYLVNEDEFTVIGKKLGKRFRLGDRLEVKLMNAEIDSMRIDFNVI